MIDIREIPSAEKSDYLDLLLLADPDKSMVDRYLPQSKMYCIFEDDKIVCEAAVIEVNTDTVELKNLATCEEAWGRGFGTKMLCFLCREYSERYDYMILGTATQIIPFYERMGFKYTHTVYGFFRDNYAEPIIEDGEILVDMQYLKKDLK